MRCIVRYQPATDQYSTRRLAAYGPDGAPLALDLCEIEGVIYASCEADLDLSPWADLGAAAATLNAALRAQIKAASPHCALIKARAHERVRAMYCPMDQTKLDRLIGASAAGLVTLTEGQRAAISSYLACNLAADQWAAEQYADLGL